MFTNLAIVWGPHFVGFWWFLESLICWQGHQFGCVGFRFLPLRCEMFDVTGPLHLFDGPQGPGLSTFFLMIKLTMGFYPFKPSKIDQKPPSKTIQKPFFSGFWLFFEGFNAPQWLIRIWQVPWLPWLGPGARSCSFGPGRHWIMDYKWWKIAINNLWIYTKTSKNIIYKSRIPRNTVLYRIMMD